MRIATLRTPRALLRTPNCVVSIQNAESHAQRTREMHEIERRVGRRASEVPFLYSDWDTFPSRKCPSQRFLRFAGRTRQRGSWPMRSSRPARRRASRTRSWLRGLRYWMSARCIAFSWGERGT